MYSRSQRVKTVMCPLAEFETEESNSEFNAEFGWNDMD